MNGILVPPAPGAASATLRLTARPFPHCALARGGHCSAPEHRRLSAASPHLQAALMVAATRECGGESDGESGGEKVLMLAAGCWGGWWLRAARHTTGEYCRAGTGFIPSVSMSGSRSSVAHVQPAAKTPLKTPLAILRSLQVFPPPSCTRGCAYSVSHTQRIRRLCLPPARAALCLSLPPLSPPLAPLAPLSHSLSLTHSLSPHDARAHPQARAQIGKIPHASAHSVSVCLHSVRRRVRVGAGMRVVGDACLLCSCTFACVRGLVGARVA